jgi:hypothetical protein
MILKIFWIMGQPEVRAEYMEILHLHRTLA